MIIITGTYHKIKQHCELLNIVLLILIWKHWAWYILLPYFLECHLIGFSWFIVQWTRSLIILNGNFLLKLYVSISLQSQLSTTYIRNAMLKFNRRNEINKSKGFLYKIEFSRQKQYALLNIIIRNQIWLKKFTNFRRTVWMWTCEFLCNFPKIILCDEK